MNPRRTMAALALAACLALAAGALAQAPITDARDLDERLKRIERLLESEGLVRLFEEVESLGAEIRGLRGQLEMQTHTINQIRERQRELYLDIDQRLQRIESGAPLQTAGAQQPAAAAPAAPAAPGTATAAAPSASPAPATPQPSQSPAQPSASTAMETAATTATAAAPAGVDPFAEQQAYQSAFDLLKSGRYEDAAAALRQFITTYPAGSYADNAQYWLGETHYITRRFDLALQEFQRLVSEYPGSQKLAGALLKIGYTHDELGNKAEAEQVLSDLVERYPQSAAAGLARKRLLSIRGQ